MNDNLHLQLFVSDNFHLNFIVSIQFDPSAQNVFQLVVENVEVISMGNLTSPNPNENAK